MDILHTQLAQLVPAFAATLIAALWQSTLLVAVSAILLQLIPATAMTAAIRSRIWAGVFLLAVLLPFIPSTHTSAETAASNSTLHVGYVWAVALAAAWAMLSLYRGIHLILSAFRLRGIVSRSKPIPAGPELSPLLALRRAFARHQTVQLCTSDEVDVPSVAGFFRPRILLPPALRNDLSLADLRQIMLHEMEHLRRADDWTNLLQKLGLVLFPLNPALLWVERRLCVERELACDDAVLRSTGANKAYATCLANLAEHSLLRRGLSLALGAWQRPSELTRRVHRILRPPQQSASSRCTTVFAAAVFGAVLTSGIALTRFPQLITFTETPSTSIASSVLGVSARKTPSEPTPSFHTITTPAPHPVLVNAIMPSRHNAETAMVTKRAKSTPKPQLAHPHSTFVDAPQPSRANQHLRVVLSGWQQQSGDTGRIVFAVSQDSNFTYAAVPFAIQFQDGWLLIQL